MSTSLELLKQYCWKVKVEKFGEKFRAKGSRKADMMGELVTVTKSAIGDTKELAITKLAKKVGLE